MATSFKRQHAHIATPSAPNPAVGHYRPTPPPKTPGHSRESLGQSLVGSLLLLPRSWCSQCSVCALQESISPVLCKIWQLSGAVNSDLQEGLCHTQVCCTQSPCPCSSPLLTCTSTGDTQAQFCLSLCGVSCILFRNVLYHFEEIPFYSLLVDIFFLFFNQERVFSLVK